ncbi:7929_t:CDS:2 [Rhizophagus irregularis]|nr:7929_t:CDS:2 [Rhizophagus irregularis]
METNETPLPPQINQQTKRKNPSEKSSSDAAGLYAKVLDPETKTRYSGPHFFGLHLEVLQQARDAHRQVTILKSFDNLTSTGQNNRAKKIAKSVYAIFDQTTTESCHSEDDPSLKSIEFNIKKKSFHFSVGKENTEELKHKARAAVQACDKGQITREGYRNLASISHDLPREWKVSAERKEITYEMNEIIPISLVNIAPPLSDNSLNSEAMKNPKTDAAQFSNDARACEIDSIQLPKRLCLK